MRMLSSCRRSLSPRNCLRPLGEVEHRQLHLPARQQLAQLAVEEVHVQRVEVLEVQVAVSVAGRVLAVHEVIVERQRHGAQAVGHQLHGQPLAEGGLARRRRPGHQHETHLPPGSRDAVGYGGNLLLVQRLGHLDEVRRPPRPAQGVELPHVVYLQDAVPFHIFIEYLEQLGLRHDGFEPVRLPQGRHAHEEAAVQRHEVVQVQAVRRGHEHPRVVVDVVVDAEIARIGRAERLEQRHLPPRSPPRAKSFITSVVCFSSHTMGRACATMASTRSFTRPTTPAVSGAPSPSSVQ